ncbi:MAG: siroheme synthase, partial [Chloroflexi bacterium]|nr:siroheme synthase [Chloroflexota bacterium]
AELISAGRAPATPVAVIQWGTTPRQKVVTGTLVDIAGRASELGSPATIVIGEVVSRKRASARGRR